MYVYSIAPEPLDRLTSNLVCRLLGVIFQLSLNMDPVSQKGPEMWVYKATCILNGKTLIDCCSLSNRSRGCQLVKTTEPINLKFCMKIANVSDSNIGLFWF